MSKPVYVSHIINGVAMTNGVTGVTIAAVATKLSGKDNCGYEVSWTTGPTGTFKVEISNSAASDDNGAGAQGQTLATKGTIVWIDISADILFGDGSTFASHAPSGTAGSFFVNLPFISAAAVRISYTGTAGTTGKLDVFLSMKEVG